MWKNSYESHTGSPHVERPQSYRMKQCLIFFKLFLIYELQSAKPSYYFLFPHRIDYIKNNEIQYKIGY